MRTEKQKMIAGDLYDPSDPTLSAERQRTRTLCQQLNGMVWTESTIQRKALLASLFATETDVYITTPFFCDYGYNIKLGAKVYFNFNCVVLDVAPVSIGNDTLFGPGVHVYTASHPMSVAERRVGLEFGKAVAIGDDVWVGGGAIICPGVSVGAGAVIGAGSVVTRDIPEGVFAAGNPCRIIRKV